jgi:hypothetical protein
LVLGMVFVAWISLRAVNRLAGHVSWCLAAQSSAQMCGPPGWEMKAAHLTPENVAKETNMRLQGAIDQLERRLIELEHTATQNSSTTLAESKALNLQVSSPPFAAKGVKSSGVSLSLGDGASLIFLPREERIPPFRACRNLLQRLWKWFQPARIAKSP